MGIPRGIFFYFLCIWADILSCRSAAGERYFRTRNGPRRKTDHIKAILSRRNGWLHSLHCHLIEESHHVVSAAPDSRQSPSRMPLLRATESRIQFPSRVSNRTERLAASNSPRWAAIANSSSFQATRNLSCAFAGEVAGNKTGLCHQPAFLFQKPEMALTRQRPPTTAALVRPIVCRPAAGSSGDWPVRVTPGTACTSQSAASVSGEFDLHCSNCRLLKLRSFSPAPPCGFMERLGPQGSQIRKWPCCSK